MFEYHKDGESLEELKEVLFRHYCQKLDEEVEKVWNEKNMSNEMMQFSY